MRRLSWLLGVSCALAACGGDDGDRPTGAATVAVRHYDYRFDIESRAAHAAIDVVIEQPGNCISLPFRAEGFDPATARIGGAPATSGRLEGDVLELCGAGWEATEQVTLEVDQVVPLKTLSSSQVGYSVTRDFEQNPFHYMVSWVGGCDRFGPCDHRPDQFATYTFHVTHPATLMVRCPGTITEVSPTETTCDFTHDGGPTYSTFGLAAYPRTAWTQTDMGRWGSAKVTVYDRAQTGIAAEIDPAYHAGFVQFMEATFGAYPYGDELRVLTAPTYWSGFEHPGNIVLDDLLASPGSAYLHPVAHVLDHEIAHQWAGDQTTLAGTYDFVWKEAMAEYLAFVYETTADPPAAASTAAAWKSFSRGAGFFPVPGDKPELFRYYGDVYGPGPMVLFRQLEVLSSREQVLAGLRSVLGRPRALSVDDLVAALEASTGLSLGDYAAAWLHGTGAPTWPTVALSFSVGGATDFLHVDTTTGAERRCKFHVALRGANPGEQRLVEVDTFRDGPAHQVRIQPQLDYNVTAIELDPLRECLVYPASIASTVQAPRRHPWLSPRAGQTSP